MRLVHAEILKLRRRTGMMALTALLTVGATAIYVAALLVTGADVRGLHRFEDAVAVLAMTASVVGVIVGATAGGADIEAGVFRDLAATGRSRIALLLARVPGAWAVLAPMLLAAVALAAVLTGVSDPGALARGAGAVLASGGVTSAVCVGLAALSGSRGAVIGVALAFQLGVSPLLGQIEAIGDARRAIPQIAVSRIASGDEFALSLALGVLVAWTAGALAAGIWRTQTQEI
jgi:hypothetical protein